MDNFYSNLLNIGGLPNKEELFKNIEDVLSKEIEPLKEDNPKLYLLCKIVSILVYNGLKDRGIKSKIVRTNELYDMYEHHFVITSYMDNNETKYVLIDPTFIQFQPATNDFHNILPVEILGETRRKLALNLVKRGFSIIDSGDLNEYIASIYMAKKYDKTDKKVDEIIFDEEYSIFDLTIDDIMLERRHK